MMAGAVLGLVLLASLTIVLATNLRGTRVSARDIAWIAGTPDSSEPEAAVYARYLARHRRHRYVGGLFGLLFATVVGIRLYSTVSMGVGQQSPLADLLFCAVAGVIIGALSAETFRLSEPASSTISASLAEHPRASRPELIRTARGVGLASLLVGVLVAATGNGLTSLAVAVGGLAVTGVAEVTQTAIAGRRRPVLSDRARIVDLRMRAFASASVAQLQLAAAVLTAAWTVAKVPGVDAAPATVVQLVLAFGGLVATIVLLRRASPRPSRGWVAAPA